MLKGIEKSSLDKESLNEDLFHELIAQRAYQLYATRGYLDGFHLQDWLQAEQEFLRQFDQQIEVPLTAAG